MKILLQKKSLLQPSSIMESEVQNYLCSAIYSERCKRWDKTIEEYGKLLKNVQIFSKNADLEPNYNQLLYESYFHLGIAFQNLNQHRKAIHQYNKALQASYIGKKVCTVGCVNRSCLETPVLARRAFALVKCGEMKEARKDAERAIALDISNPDVYCIRALVWNTLHEKERAIKDLNHGLWLNPFHWCSRILKYNIQKSITSEGSTCSARNNKLEKALKIHCGSSRYLTVKDFNSPEILLFYDRFLWSLNVPHTVMAVRLPPADVSVHDALTHSKRTTSADAKQTNEEKGVCHRVQSKPFFRCGSATTYSNKYGLEMRINYGAALRSQMRGLCRPKTFTSKHLAKTAAVCSVTADSQINYSFSSSGFISSHHRSPARMYERPWEINKRNL
ncbi:haloacid dehalogenase-like hydrolase domain-containing 2 [Pelobates cultripes]|uniref:Haloacid dehalogenase-like hydrolase domain-containing 2 n=1 Tax=Pelobates cultripes TaxID=61616 RepID=A0AAD1RT90_PELCU|nr:haloacid dehalogenase-like hydrolase domain-containing 2 [Pelobates cultripes]